LDLERILMNLFFHHHSRETIHIQRLSQAAHDNSFRKEGRHQQAQITEQDESIDPSKENKQKEPQIIPLLFFFDRIIFRVAAIRQDCSIRR
jgi:hypothetical protein